MTTPVGAQGKSPAPPLFITDVELDTVFKAVDFAADDSYNQFTGPVPDMHAFYDALHPLATLPLPFPSCISASENDYLYVGDADEDFVLALEDLNDDHDCYDLVGGLLEHSVFFDGSAALTYGGNAAGIRTQAPTGVTARLLTEVWLSNANTDLAGNDSIVRLKDSNGDLDANDPGEAFEFFRPSLGHPNVDHSIPNAIAIGANGLIHYVENGSGRAKGVYLLADANGNGVIDDNPFEVLPFFLPTLAELALEGVSNPVVMDLTSLETAVHDMHESTIFRRMGETWFLTDLANDVIWILEDLDADRSIEYSSGEAHAYWYASVTQPSAVREVAVDEDHRLFAVQPELPSDRLHRMTDLDGDEVIVDGSNEVSDVYDDAIAPVFMATPYSIDGDFHLHGEVGEPFCPGTAQTCSSCNNPGGTNEGCANSLGIGALLVGEGTESVSLDDLAFHASNLPDGQSALLFVGTDTVNGGAGVTFGQGLRCVGGSLIRLQLLTSQNFEAEFGPGLQPVGGWSAGDTRYFQVWYRDPQGAGSCSADPFNFSNAVQVTFTL